MSEPQTKPVEELLSNNTSSLPQEESEPTFVSPSALSSNVQTPSDQEASNDQTPNNSQTTPNSQTPDNQQQELPPKVKTLKDAFPDLDVDVIETILESQNGNLDSTFEVLLGMSDPTYKPNPQESASLNQLREDEEYARRLAREGDAHFPQNNGDANVNLQQQQQQLQQPLFNFQEELPMIKEKVIEVGTAAKNKIMNLYNQFMAPGPEQQGTSSLRNESIETGMNNLNLSDDAQRQNAPPSQVTTRRSVDLYEWNGQTKAPQQPALERKTSTSVEQLLSDEEFARQLAREDAEQANTANTTVVTQDTTLQDSDTNSNKASPDVKSTKITNTGSQEEQTNDKLGGYSIHDDDDLDDLFDKQGM
ncbi:MAG: hypothetical protein EXX96DRAFT_573926 [Benjaminiella poitrasii]|nr:MAG: hypothetical protein EXX96DRAFT_573926 [Benjaminiella poitrasii]